jgi:hypothetical protein
VAGLLVAVPLILWTGNDEEAPATTGATTTTEAVTTTEAPTTTVAPTTTLAAVPSTIPPMPASLEMTWTQAPTQEAFGFNDGIWQVIEGGPGLIAVGNVLEPSREERCASEGDCFGWVDAAVWVSSDGLTWTKVGDPTEFSGVPNQFGTEMHQLMTDVTAGPGGYVAVGRVDRDTGDVDPPIWFSADGIAWERIRGDTEGFSSMVLGSVVSTDTGYLAAGTGAWFSPDGRRWTRIDDGSLGIDPESLNTQGDLQGRLAFDGGRYVFTIPNVAVGNGDTGMAVMVSVDGVSWQPYTIIDDGLTTDVAVIDGRFVVAGFDASGKTVWTSDDGTRWERLGVVDESSRPLIHHAPAAVDGRWVTGTMESFGAATILASADDGLTWYEVISIDSSPEGPYTAAVDQIWAGIRDLVAFEGGFIAVGGTGNGSAPVWVGAWNN